MKIKRSFVTPYITLLFLVIALSGTLMLFHIFDGYTEVLHELLGVLFLIFSVLHLLVNWKSLATHLKKKSFIFSSILILLLSAGIVIMGKGHGDYQRYIVKKLSNADLVNTLEILEIDYSKADSILKEKNIVIGNCKTITEIALKYDKPSKDILEFITE